MAKRWTDHIDFDHTDDNPNTLPKNKVSKGLNNMAQDLGDWFGGVHKRAKTASPAATYTGLGHASVLAGDLARGTWEGTKQLGKAAKWAFMPSGTDNKNKNKNKNKNPTKLNAQQRSAKPNTPQPGRMGAANTGSSQDGYDIEAKDGRFVMTGAKGSPMYNPDFTGRMNTERELLKAASVSDPSTMGGSWGSGGSTNANQIGSLRWDLKNAERLAEGPFTEHGRKARQIRDQIKMLTATDGKQQLEQIKQQGQTNRALSSQQMENQGNLAVEGLKGQNYIDKAQVEGMWNKVIQDAQSKGYSEKALIDGMSGIIENWGSGSGNLATIDGEQQQITPQQKLMMLMKYYQLANGDTSLEDLFGGMNPGNQQKQEK